MRWFFEIKKKTESLIKIMRTKTEIIKDNSE